MFSIQEGNPEPKHCKIEKRMNSLLSGAQEVKIETVPVSTVTNWLRKERWRAK